MIFDSDLLLYLRTSDIIDEVSANDVYLGFFEKGVTDEDSDSAFCSICHIVKTSTITTLKWSNGNKNNKDVLWKDRKTTVTYAFPL